MGQKVMSNMTCYIWMCWLGQYVMQIFGKGPFLPKILVLKNLYNARVAVNETILCCRLLLGLQSIPLNVWISSKTIESLKHISNDMWFINIGHANEILTIKDQSHSCVYDMQTMGVKCPSKHMASRAFCLGCYCLCLDSP